jgi:hypothetical protein
MTPDDEGRGRGGREQADRSAAWHAKAENIAEAQKSAGVGVIDSIGRTVRRAAEDLESELPAVAPYVAEAASGLEAATDKLRDRSIGEIVETVSEFGRRQPAMFIAGSVLLGLLLSRFVKSGAGGAVSGVEQRSSDHG